MNDMMVKYTAEQIDQVLAILTAIAGDTKAYECSLPMLSVVLDLNNFLRNNAVVYEEEKEEISSTEIFEEAAESETDPHGSEEDIILSSGGAE